MKLASLFVEVGANVNNFERGMKNVRSEIDQTSKHASLFSNTLATALGTGVTLAVSKATSSLTEFVSHIKKIGEEFNSLKENSTLAFETMLGSTEQAKSFLSDLQRFAETTPFELPGLIDASQKMVAFGFTAKEVIPNLTAIGDAVAGLGGSPEKLNRVIMALGQIKAKGKAQAQEMMQLTEAGIPAWDLLAKKLGMSIPDAMEKVEKGFTTAEREAEKAAGNTGKAMTRQMVNANTAISAIIEGMNQKFGGLMEKQAKSFTGLKSNFNDLLRAVAAKVTKPWFDNAKKGLEGMLKLMQSDKFNSFVESAVRASTKIADTTFKIKGFFFGLLGKGFNFFHNLFGTDSQAKKSVGILDLIPKKIKQIITFLKPIGSFIYAIADKGFRVLTSTFDDFYRSFNKISNQRFYFFGDMSLGQFASGIKAIFKEVTSGGKSLNYWLYTAPKVFQVVTRIMLSAKNIFSYFSGEGLQTTLKKLGSILTGLGSILSKLVRPFKDALGGLFTQLSTMKNLGFADIFKTILSSIAQAFTGFLKVIREEFWPTIKGALVWVWDSLTAFITSINWSSVWESVTGVFIGLYQFVQSIDWGSVGTAVVSVFNTIVDYVASLNWEALWTTIWSGLSAINSILKDTVFPALGSFFDWLLSWFLDDTKRQALSNAINKTWLFVADWASYIWQGVSPYLSSFFGWLVSWFTDQSKRSQLWNAVSTTWDFITQWTMNLWNWASPGLSSFFGYLLSWVTDPTKRGQLWSGISNSWNWITQWGSTLATWLAPYLSNFWNWLVSWVIDPSKNQTLKNNLAATWTGFTTWASGLWASMSPFFASTDSNINQWLVTNKPDMIPWYQSIKDFLLPTSDNWKSNFTKMKNSVIDLKDTLKVEIPAIGEEIGKLYKTLFGEGQQTTFMDWVTYAVENVTYKIKTLVTQISIVIEMINLVNEGWSKVFSGDFAGYAALSGKWNDLMNQLWNSTGTPPTMPGFATGGIVQGGSVLVGEKGPEVVDLPRGSRVWDHGQSMGKLDSSSNQTFTIILKNEGNLPTDRRVIDEIATQLQRRLAMQGNRLVFA